LDIRVGVVKNVNIGRTCNEFRFPEEKGVSKMIPDVMVDRLASEIARRSGYNPNECGPQEWANNKARFEETAKQYLRVALGYSVEFDLPNEVTYNSDTLEIKGVDENWYEVPQPVLMRYVMTAGIAGANLSEYSDRMLTDEQLERACDALYPGVFKFLSNESKQKACAGVRQILVDAQSVS
jgi:hypothetical protein